MKTGVKLYVRPNDHLSRWFRYFGIYERRTCRILREQADPDKVFLDVGVNLGLHCIGLAKDVGCPVAGFEPHPPTLEVLEKSIKENGVEDKVTIFEIALIGRGRHGQSWFNP